MTHKQKRDYIKEQDDFVTKAYLESRGLIVEDLKIDIRYDGYISAWSKGFTGDIVSYVFDILKLFTDLYEVIDNVYSFMSTYEKKVTEKKSNEEIEREKLEKAHRIINVCRDNVSKLLETDHNELENQVKKLIPLEVWKINPNKMLEVVKKFIGVDVYGDVAICLPNTVAIRKGKSNMKWQSFGIRKDISYNIKDNGKAIYILFGMKEIILMELLELNYLIFQCDSMVKYLKDEHKKILADREIIIIPDNDISCFKAAAKCNNLLYMIASTKILTDFKEEKEDLINYLEKYELKKTLQLLDV